MAGPEFFLTGMGRRYYEATMPRIAKALERIADALEAANKQSASTQPSTTAASTTPPTGD